MLQIYDSLKALVAPELSKAASALGESEEKVSNASSGILAGILAGILKQGKNSQTDSVLRESGKNNLLCDVTTVFSGRMGTGEESAGRKLLNSIFGGNTSGFTNAIAKDSGISEANASKLTTMLSTVVAGFLGRKLVNGNLGASEMMTELDREKNRFMGLVPAGAKNFLAADGKYVETQRIDPPVQYGRTPKQPEKKKGKWNWLIWLLLAIALILLIIFGWRSCKNRSVQETANTVVTNTEQVVNNAANAVKETAQEVVRKMKEFTLPNGVKIQAYENGMEDKMIAFLNSNDYKNAKMDSDLSKKWFEFEDIYFTRDSATELDANATPHLQNLVAILKAYPNAKIKIGGNADKSGNRLYNMEISKERAGTIKNKLTGMGIAANRISTEGFGDEHASWPADASATRAAEDRDIAFRFTK